MFAKSGLIPFSPGLFLYVIVRIGKNDNRADSINLRRTEAYFFSSNTRPRVQALWVDTKYEGGPDMNLKSRQIQPPQPNQPFNMLNFMLHAIQAVFQLLQKVLTIVGTLS
jgi:hypothetical protein